MVKIVIHVRKILEFLLLKGPKNAMKMELLIVCQWYYKLRIMIFKFRNVFFVRISSILLKMIQNVF